MLGCKYRKSNVALIIYNTFDCADLHFIVAVSNNAIANLDVQRFNFQVILDLRQGNS